MTNLYVLHWGTINQTVKISGVDISSGNITPSLDNGVVAASAGSGRTKTMFGRGQSKGVTGRGGNG